MLKFPLPNGRGSDHDKWYIIRYNSNQTIYDQKLAMTRKERIYQLLQKEFPVIYLTVEDESHRHHVPENAETHIKLTLVTPVFEQQSKITRHRQVNKVLSGEFDTGLHALSLHLYTPEEWESKTAAPDSPACRDGFQHG